MAAATRMEELDTNDKYQQPDTLVLDVRTPAEFRRGHVPGSRNVPVDESSAIRDP